MLSYPQLNYTDEDLENIKVLFRSADCLTLWGLPYNLREGQSPRDLQKDWSHDWIYLGNPGWWGNLSQISIGRILIFLDSLEDIPHGPYEFCQVERKANASR